MSETSDGLVNMRCGAIDNHLAASMSTLAPAVSPGAIAGNLTPVMQEATP